MSYNNQKDNEKSYRSKFGKFNVVCERCAMKEAEFFCSLCQPLKNFCGNCDISVHSLVTKKSHQRTQLNPINSVNNTKNINIPSNSNFNNDTAMSTNTNNYKNLSSNENQERDNRFTNTNINEKRVNSPERSSSKLRSNSHNRSHSKNREEERERAMSPQSHHQFTTNYFNRNFHPNLNEMYNNFPVSTSHYLGGQGVSSPTLTPNRNTNRNVSPGIRLGGVTGQSHRFNPNATPSNPGLINGYYSKQYVNELKSMFDKEKEELLHKNQALSNNLERLKNTFNDQIYLLQKELSDAKTKSINEVGRITEEYEQTIFHMREVFKEKEDKLKEVNKRLIQENNQVQSKLEHSMTQANASTEENTKKINDLENSLEKKSKELQETSNFLKKQIEEQKRNFNRDIDGLVDRYENTIQRMNNDFEKELNSKFNQLERCNDKINELENIIEKNQRIYDDSLLDKNGVIEQLKADKFNIQRENDSMKITKNNLSLKIESLEKSDAAMKNDINLKGRDMEYIQSELNSLKSENSNLKLQNNSSLNEISKLKQIIENYQRNSDSQMNELFQMQEAYDTLKKSNDILNTHCRGLEKNVESHKSALSNLQKENQETNFMKDDLKSENYKISSTMDMLKSDNIKLQRELEIVDLEREKLKMENYNIREEVSVFIIFNKLQ